MSFEKCALCGSNNISPEGYCMSCGTPIKTDTMNVPIPNYSVEQSHSHNNYEQSYSHNPRYEGNYSGRQGYSQGYYNPQTNLNNTQYCIDDNSQNQNVYKNKNKSIVPKIVAVVIIAFMILGMMNIVIPLVANFVSEKNIRTEITEAISANVKTDTIVKPEGCTQPFTKFATYENVYENEKFYRIDIQEDFYDYDEKTHESTDVVIKYSIYLDKSADIENINTEKSSFRFTVDEKDVNIHIRSIYDGDVEEKINVLWYYDNSDVLERKNNIKFGNLNTETYVKVDEYSNEYFYLTDGNGKCLLCTHVYIDVDSEETLNPFSAIKYIEMNIEDKQN